MKKNFGQLPLIEISDITIDQDNLVKNNQQTAKTAIKILIGKNKDLYKSLTPIEKRNLTVAFAYQDKIVYGKAFDIIKIANQGKINFFDIEDIRNNIDNIIVCEIKSTRKETKKDNFRGYFFGLTTAELLVAQNLKENYRFIFVNVLTEDILELTLKEIFEKAKGIYPQWSISF